MNTSDDSSDEPDTSRADHEYAEQDAKAARMNSFVHHPLVRTALRSAVAAGVAYQLGSWLPWVLGQYPYYASLGAVTVSVPAMSDSVKEALRVTGAIVVGVLLGVGAQAVAWPSAVTVAVVIGVGTVVGLSRFFGGQRGWVPLAALFVLTVRGTSTDTYGLIYLLQISLGAAVALALTLLFPPLPLHEVTTAVTRMRHLLVGQLREMVDVLGHDDVPARGQWEERLGELSPPRQQMRSLANQAKRARTGNVRARRWGPVHANLLNLCHALERCSWLVEDLGVVLVEYEQRDYSIFGAELRERLAETLGRLADVLDSPDRSSPVSLPVREAEKAVDALLDQVDRERFPDRADRYLAGAVAVTARRCLHSYTRRHER